MVRRSGHRGRAHVGRPSRSATSGSTAPAPGATISPGRLSAPPPDHIGYRAPTGLTDTSLPPSAPIATPAPVAPPAGAAKLPFPVWLGGSLAAGAVVAAMVALVLV